MFQPNIFMLEENSHNKWSAYHRNWLQTLLDQVIFDTGCYLSNIWQSKLRESCWTQNSSMWLKQLQQLMKKIKQTGVTAGM